jgi:hypothetical protein
LWYFVTASTRHYCTIKKNNLKSRGTIDKKQLRNNRKKAQEIKEHEAGYGNLYGNFSKIKN